MKQLHQQRRWKELVAQFSGEDFAAWPAAAARPAAEALHLRGQAYAALKNGKQAEADLKGSIRLVPEEALVWHALAENYARNLTDEREALAAYRKVVAITGHTNGWLPINSTLEIAKILTDRVETDEALRTLDAYGDAPEMPATWKIRLLRAYGHAYASRGDEQASLTKFREALELEVATVAATDPASAETPAPRPASGTSDAPGFQAGVAKVEITPAADTAIDLLGRRLAPRDPLFARVLYLENDDTSLAIVSLDLIVFASPKVVAEAKRRWGVDHMILCATHTHSGAAPRGLVIQPPHAPDWTRGDKAPADWIDWPALSADPWYAATEEKVVAAIGEAKRNRFAARVATAKGPFESAYMAHNRRLVRDGTATAMWENPDRRPTQPVDPTVGVIRVEDTAGRPRAIVVQYACHPVGLMGAGVVSADFPGAMCDYVEREVGGDCMAMFLQGASGDLDPYDLHNLRGENRFNIVKQCGISLGKGALRVAAQAKTADRSSTLRVDERLMTISYRHGNRLIEVGLLTAVINGDTVLAAIPGEPFIQHQLDLAASSPLPKTFVLGLAYHGRGTPFVVYIPTEQAVKEGGYGAAECSFVAADAGATMVREAVAAIRALLQKPD